MSRVGHPNDRFSGDLLRWYDHHGRKSLPWQRSRDPYAIWISEIMLQQTQVATVIPYYQKFMARFVDVDCLAIAPLDDVLHHWSGLGYYARARNLHAAAGLIQSDHHGRFPLQFDDVLALPGIGRSTAGSILAFATGQRHPILDGNVKRVLTRFFTISGYPGHRRTQSRLWELADQLTPRIRIGDYNQAIMDLGATVCVRRNPACPSCPLNSNCAAHREGDPHAYPTRRVKTPRPARSTSMLIVVADNEQVLLLRRPPKGIWGGLWSLPEFDGSREEVKDWCQSTLGLSVEPGEPHENFRHAFSHYDLTITPIPVRVTGAGGVMDSGEYLWYNPQSPARIGLPTPVSRILATYRKSS